MYRQKALDLSAAPTLPRPILLYRARGIEDIEADSDDDDDETEESVDEKENN